MVRYRTLGHNTGMRLPEFCRIMDIIWCEEVLAITLDFLLDLSVKCCLWSMRFVAGWLNGATNVIQTCFGSVFLMVAPVHGKVILHLGYMAHYAGTLPCFFSFDMHQCRFLVYQQKVSVFECLICCLCCLLLIWSGQPPDLKKYMDKQLQIKLNANRMIVGTLRGFDQFMNLVVGNTVEVNGNEKNDIGMMVIRGNNVVTVEALEPVNRSI
ncbi:hypothetical protein KIW84_012777 [Lathyrus oleraceus]|uniref:Small nuclear ribonucleoprotein G n=1 Tax=Pisum sativum TaxID=3888 RepID=A0A9D5BIL7_PEA|nr:hypothetical protein KIW84_012777 [Pisum sativum]